MTRLTAAVLAILLLPLAALAADTPVNFRLAWKYGPENAGYYVALEKGYYKAEGLDVKIAQGAGSLENIQLLGAGELKIAEVDAGAVLTGRGRGVPVVSVAVLYQRLPMGLVSMKKTPLTEPKSLLGLRVGRNPKSVTSVGLDAFIRQHQLDKSKIQLVPTGFGPEPLLAGQLDAQTTFVNTDAMVLRDKGHDVNVLNFADWGLKGYGYTISVSEAALKSDEDTVAKFVRASLKGWKEAMENPQAAAEIFAKHHPSATKAFALRVIEATRPLVESDATRSQGVGWQTAEGWEQTQELYLTGGTLKEKVDVKPLFTTKFAR